MASKKNSTEIPGKVPEGKYLYKQIASKQILNLFSCDHPK